MKEKKVKAWLIEDGRWATNQMLVYQTKKSAEERVYQGGMSTVWKVNPCIILIRRGRSIKVPAR